MGFVSIPLPPTAVATTSIRDNFSTARYPAGHARKQPLNYAGIEGYVRTEGEKVDAGSFNKSEYWHTGKVKKAVVLYKGGPVKRGSGRGEGYKPEASLRKHSDGTELRRQKTLRESKKRHSKNNSQSLRPTRLQLLEIVSGFDKAGVTSPLNN